MKTEELLTKIQLQKQKNSAVGLDIGKDSVKVVELVREGETIKVSKVDLAKVPLSSGAGPGQTQIIKRNVANLLAKNQIKTKDIIFGINGQSIFVKFLDILPVSAENLEKTIRYEAQQQIPFSLEEVEWDAHLFETPQGKEQESSPYHVLLVAIKKDKLTSRRMLVEEIKLRPSVLDVNTLSVYNCVRFNRNFDESKLTAVLNIGAESTDLLILKGNDFWMRSFAIGGNNITVALRDKLNIGFDEAEKLKLGMSLDSPDIKEAVKPVLENLQGEITRSIEYYYFQQKKTPLQQVVTEQAGSDGSATSRDTSAQGAKQIDQILLSGGTSLMQGLDRFLSENFSTEVKLVEPFRMLHLDEEVAKRLDSWNKVLFTTAVGLALRGLSKSYVNVNLLKEQIRLRKMGYQRLAYGVSSLVLSLLILFGASTFMRQDYREKNFRLQHLKGLLNTFSTHHAEIEDLQSKTKLLSREVKALSNVAQNRALWLEVSSELQKMLPDNLWITELAGTISFDISVDENFASKLDLQGKATSYKDVNSFVSKLKSSTLFTEVKPLSSAFIEEQAVGEEKKEKVEVVKFSISMKVLCP